MDTDVLRTLGESPELLDAAVESIRRNYRERANDILLAFATATYADTLAKGKLDDLPGAEVAKHLNRDFEFAREVAALYLNQETTFQNALAEELDRMVERIENASREPEP